MPRVAQVGVILLLLVGFAALALFFLRRPKVDAEWAPDQARLPGIAFEEGAVTVSGVRDFAYAGSEVTERRYRDETYRRADARRVWFALAPFADRYRGLAHSFVTFEFADDRFVAVSVEARREAHEGYSLTGGLMRAFEVTYVVGTEEDLLGLRALRGDQLYLYPSVASPDQTWALFADMMRRARETQESPEFYNTLWNNCNTNLRDHVNRATTAELPWGWGILLPGYSDALALEQGVLDTDLDLEGARARFRVDARIRQVLAEGGASFSRRIREGVGFTS